MVTMGVVHEALMGFTQGCHKGRNWRKITVRTSARVSVYPADGFLRSADAKKKKKINFFYFLFF
jgi:hypothetical protein